MFNAITNTTKLNILLINTPSLMLIITAKLPGKIRHDCNIAKKIIKNKKIIGKLI